MSPRAGGEAAKIGSRYEAAWTNRQLLRTLAGGIDSITVEDVGELSVGSEFTIRAGGAVEVHQVKRQAGLGASWTVVKMINEGVLKAALEHGLAGRSLRFVSMTPAPVFEELGDRARRFGCPVSRLRDGLSKTLGADFDAVVRHLGSEEAAATALASLFVECIPEREMNEANSVIASSLFPDAEPTSVVDALSAIVLEDLGVELTAQNLMPRLAQRGFHRPTRAAAAANYSALASVTERWVSGVRRELLATRLTRQVSNDVWSAMTSDARVVVITGKAGAGKSAVVLDVVDRAIGARWPVLAVRLDRLGEFGSAAELATSVGITVPPVAALAAVAARGSSLLVVDQLDAVSALSGRSRATLDAVDEIVRAAAAFADMRVVLACREFDAQHDAGLRALLSGAGGVSFAVELLSPPEVDDAVKALGLHPDELSPSQRDLLALPLNLVLLAAVVSLGQAPAFASSKELFDSFWDVKRAAHVQAGGSEDGFFQVLSRIATSMSESAQLRAPRSILDSGGLVSEGDRLASANVLVRDGPHLSFFHESFFDYTFARVWCSRNESLDAFLLAGDQDLFCRGQVRQVLVHLREERPALWRIEVEALLTSPRVRFHVKDVVLALLRSLPDPTNADLLLVERVRPAAEAHGFALRLDAVLGSLQWFELLAAEGVLGTWLCGTDERLRTVASHLLVTAAADRADDVVTVLTAVRASGVDVGYLVAAVCAFRMPECRALFEMLLDAVRAGVFDGREGQLWSSMAELASARPEWAAELVAVFIAERPASWSYAPEDKPWRSGYLVDLEVHDHWALETVRAAGEGAPATFCSLVLPLVLRAAALTAQDDGFGALPDRHFSHRIPGASSHDVGDVLAATALSALRRLFADDFEAARVWLERLAVCELDVAQWLLYEAISAAIDAVPADGRNALADWTAEVMLEGEYRFLSGMNSDPFWHAGVALAAIAPEVSGGMFSRLERAVLEFAAPWDARRAGRSQFTLLAALDRGPLSQPGLRRLQELRRLFGLQAPLRPEGITGGFLGSPIGSNGVERMTDEQWLRAIEKHASDDHDWEKMTAGASGLASSLKSRVIVEPERFAQLLLRLDRESHPAYAASILHGLGEAAVGADVELVAAAVRHVAGWARPVDDRWLGWPLHRYAGESVPLDLIELLLDRALHSDDPSSERAASLDSSLEADTDQSDGDSIAFALSSAGMNCSRGSAADSLAVLLVRDQSGERTAVVASSLIELAADPSLAVRAIVAEILVGCLRHARVEVLQAFRVLTDAADTLLAVHAVQDLIVYLSYKDASAMEPTLDRMVVSDIGQARVAGGALQGFVGLERERSDLLAKAVSSPNRDVRQGAAQMCAARLPITSERDIASSALVELLADDDAGVSDVAAGVAASLRGQPLAPYAEVLRALVRSPSLSSALSQLFITLEQAPDRLDDLIFDVVEEVLHRHADELSDLRTGVAADARHAAELVLRVYQQATDGAARTRALDLIDRLLLVQVYGMADLVDRAGR